MSQHQCPHRRCSLHYQEDAGEYEWIQACYVWIDDTMFHTDLYKFNGKWLRPSMTLLISQDAVCCIFFFFLYATHLFTLRPNQQSLDWWNDNMSSKKGNKLFSKQIFKLPFSLNIQVFTLFSNYCCDSWSVIIETDWFCHYIIEKWTYCSCSCFSRL